MAPGSFMHVAAEHFDFFTVVDGGGFDFFGTGIAEEAQTDGGDVALMFMPGEEELVVPLADAFAGQSVLDFVLLISFADALLSEFDAGVDLSAVEKWFEGVDDFRRSSGEQLEARRVSTYCRILAAAMVAAP